MISRRKYLLGVSAVTAGAVAGVSGAAWSSNGAPPAHAVERFRYRGRDVRIMDEGPSGGVHVTINGTTMVHVERIGPGRHVAHPLPFNEYRTVRELVEDVIDAEDAELFTL